jgi:hypothetical protein
MSALRHRIGIAVGAVAASVCAVALSACGATYTYLTSSSSQSYLAVPHSWKVFDQHTIESKSGSTGSFPYLAFFDANKRPSLNDSLRATVQPWGIIRIRDLSASEQSTYSFDSLSNEFIQLDQLTQSGEAQVVGSPEVVTEGGLRGIREEVEVEVGKNQNVIFEQAGYINNTTTKAWSLLVGCSATCFQQHQSEITRLVHSWTVGKH